MSDIAATLAANGERLLLGVTVLLSAGSLAAMLSRAPIYRQRLGEGTILAVLFWLTLATAPLPHWNIPRFTTSKFTKPVRDESQVRGEANTTVTTASTAPVNAVLNNDLWSADAHQRPMAADPPVETGDNSARPLFLPIQWNRFENSTAAAEEKTSGSPSTQAQNFFGIQQLRTRLAWIFLAGSAGCVAWLSIAHCLLTRTIRTSKPPPEWLEALIAEIAPGTTVRLLVSLRCGRPICFGLRRPTIVLPVDYFDEARRGALAHVLRHELIHLRQGDAWGRLLFNAALPLLYCHPLYWRLRSQVHLAAELIADDAAAQAADPPTYVRELLTLVRRRQSQALAWTGAGMFSSQTTFSWRMRMLLERRSPLANNCPRWWQVTMAAVALTVVGLFACVSGAPTLEAQQTGDQPSRKGAEPRASLPQSAPQVAGAPLQTGAIPTRSVAKPGAKQVVAPGSDAAATSYVKDGKWRVMPAPGYWHYVCWNGNNWQWARWNGERHVYTDAPTEAAPVTPPPIRVGSPDVLYIEALELLPNRPIAGERLIRPDGTISLGYYGQLHVQDLTLAEIKAKMEMRLAQYVIDPEVYIDVASFNRSVVYVVGNVEPKRLSCKGGEMLLDILFEAKARTEDAAELTVYRVGKMRPIILRANTVELQTGRNERNYQMFPGDRVTVHDPSSPPKDAPTSPTPVTNPPPACDPFEGLRATAAGNPSPAHVKNSGTDAGRNAAKAELQQMHSQLDELKKQLAVQKASANTAGGTIEDSKTLFGNPSLPVLRHQLRIAQAECELADQAIKPLAATFVDTNRLYRSGNASKTATDITEYAVEMAKLQAARAKKVVASLQQLIADLEGDKRPPQ